MHCVEHFCIVCHPNRKDFRGQICPFPLPVTSLPSSLLLSPLRYAFLYISHVSACLQRTASLQRNVKYNVVCISLYKRPLLTYIFDIIKFKCMCFKSCLRARETAKVRGKTRLMTRNSVPFGSNGRSSGTN